MARDTIKPSNLRPCVFQSAAKRLGRSLGAAEEGRKKKGDYQGHDSHEEGYDEFDEEDEDDDLFYTKSFKSKSRELCDPPLYIYICSEISF